MALPRVSPTVTPGRPETTAARGGRGSRARWIAVAAVAVVIAIHAVITPMHLEEMFYIGVLFSVGNGLLFVAMMLLAGERHQPAGWLLAGAVCAGEFVGFVLSRTVGLPMGYHETWASAPEDYLGLVSLFLELVVVTAAVRALYATARHR
jgi:hypothetical protein